MVLTRLRPLAVVGALLATLAGAQAAAGPPSRPSTYTVGRGETLSVVAARLNLTVRTLAEANGIADVHRIRAGERLVVPERRAVARPARRAGGGGLPPRLLEHPRRLALMPHFDAAAREHRVPADLLKALAWQESGWQNDKVSATRALGIGQLMPDTVSFVNGQLLPRPLDPRRAADNIRMSARFLAYLLAQTGGDVGASVGAYYQGLASLRRDGPIPETRRYVADVLALRRKF